MAKEQYAVVHEGKFVGTQVAATAQRAIELKCHKLGLHYSREYTDAFSMANTPDFNRAMFVACFKTVRGDQFEPA